MLLHAGAHFKITLVLICSIRMLTRISDLQGDLTDPSYFDFISYAQMATVSKQIPKGQQEFEVRA